jgi:hypothetical protein
VRRLLGLILLVVGVSSCGDDTFTSTERDAVRAACLARYGEVPGDIGRFCDCSVAALERADAAKLREDRAAFLDEHLSNTTIARCS